MPETKENYIEHLLVWCAARQLCLATYALRALLMSKLVILSINRLGRAAGTVDKIQFVI